MRSKIIRIQNNIPIVDDFFTPMKKITYTE